MPQNPAQSPDLDDADTLWKSADALRGQVDAAEYKHVVLGPGQMQRLTVPVR